MTRSSKSTAAAYIIPQGASPDVSAVAVLDFGSQYTNLIRRSLRELGVQSVILPPATRATSLKQFRGIILSGGPASVYAKDAPAYDPALFDLDVPILGICYGHQLMASALGGTVQRGVAGEYGRARLEILGDDHMFTAIPRTVDVWMSRGDVVTEPPDGFTIAAATETCPVAAMANEGARRYSLQFHPEVAHTAHGFEMLQNFVIGICKCGLGSGSHDLTEDILAEIRREVGEKHVFLMLSGGVDSTVAYLLLTKALGRGRVLGLHVDTGLLRRNEVEYVKGALENAGIHDYRMVDASAEFAAGLRGITDPEAKRRVIATTFLAVKDREMSCLELDPSEWILGQGTIYPDLIASGVSQHSHMIKTHHNSLLQERTKLPIVEPLKLLYKDEVRRIGGSLGLPDDFLWREPFPGPGLAIRVLGEVTAEKLDLQRSADEIVSECLKGTHWSRELWHKFPVVGRVSELGDVVLRDGVLGDDPKRYRRSVERARALLTQAVAEHDLALTRMEPIILPFRTVGIKGDMRSYEAPLGIAFWEGTSCAWRSYEFLEELSTRLTNGVENINRVVLNLTPGGRLVADDTHAFLRLITSRDAMTADWAKLEPELLEKIAYRIVSETDIDRVWLDITQKPPAMMEWE